MLAHTDHDEGQRRFVNFSLQLLYNYNGSSISRPVGRPPTYRRRPVGRLTLAICIASASCSCSLGEPNSIKKGKHISSWNEKAQKSYRKDMRSAASKFEPESDRAPLIQFPSERRRGRFFNDSFPSPAGSSPK